MPAITATSITGVGSIAITETVLDGSDSFVYQPTKKGILTLRNATGGVLTPVIDGDGSDNVDAEGLANVDVSGGYSMGAIAAGDVAMVRLDTIKAYLAGTIAINSGTGLVATLYEF